MQPERAAPESTDAGEGEQQSVFNPRGWSLAVLRFRYCFYGALLGALAVSIVFQLFHLIFQPPVGGSAGDSGLAARLFGVAASAVVGAFLTPWGLLGGAAGAWWGSHKFDVRLRGTLPVAVNAQASEITEAEDSPLRRGELPLACGLGLLVPTAFFAPQVMSGLLALMLAPVVLALLLIGTWRVRDPDLPSARRTFGFILLLLALGGLLMTTGFTVETGVRAARLTQLRQNELHPLQPDKPSTHVEDPATAARRAQVEANLERLSRHPAYVPPDRGQPVAAAFWLAPACMGLGLSCRAGWSLWRCLFWAGAVWVFPYGMARLIQTFGSSMALSA